MAYRGTVSTHQIIHSFLDESAFNALDECTIPYLAASEENNMAMGVI